MEGWQVCHLMFFVRLRHLPGKFRQEESAVDDA